MASIILCQQSVRISARIMEMKHTRTFYFIFHFTYVQKQCSKKNTYHGKHPLDIRHLGRRAIPPALGRLSIDAFSHALRCVALRCVALRCVALRCVALRCVALRCVALRCVALRCVALRCVALRCVALRCVALRCVALRCVALRCVAHVRMHIRNARTHKNTYIIIPPGCM